MISSSRLRTRLLALVLALGLATAACTAEPGPVVDVASLDNADQEPSALGVLVEQELELLDFSECMRAEDIDIGDPTIDAEGNVSIGTPMNMISDHGKLMQAYDVCSEFIGGRPLGHSGEDRTAVHDRLVDFAKCVRDNGFYELPDPDFSGASDEIFPGLDLENPDYQVAEKACEGLLVESGAGE